MKNLKNKKKGRLPDRSPSPTDSAKENQIFQSLMEESGIKPFMGSKEKIKRPAEDSSSSLEPLETVSLPEPKGGKFAGADFPPSPKRSKKIQIKKGFQPDAQLDLHGETRNDALKQLERFIKHTRHHGLQCVLIITGKGMNSSEEGGILRKMTELWLNEIKGLQIQSFQSAPSFLGGTGAFLVFL